VQPLGIQRTENARERLVLVNVDWRNGNKTPMAAVSQSKEKQNE
jgi:hypothetical protein